MLKRPTGSGGKGRESTTAPIFTRAAEQALTLPARSLLDLWQAAQKAAQQLDNEGGQSGQDGEAAIQLAHTMLRNIINESELPFWASQLLQQKLISKNMQGKVILNLDDCHLQPSHLGSAGGSLDFQPARGDAEASWKASIQLRGHHELHLKLKPSQDDKAPLVDIPPTAAGWFMLLYDLLMISPEPRLIIGTEAPNKAGIGYVLTEHERPEEVSTDKEGLLMPVRFYLWWSTPEWDTFTDIAIFAAQWEAIRFWLEMAFKRHPALAHGRNPDFTAACARSLRLAWADSICSVAGAEYGHWRGYGFGLKHLRMLAQCKDLDADRGRKALDWLCQRTPACARERLSRSMKSLLAGAYAAGSDERATSQDDRSHSQRMGRSRQGDALPEAHRRLYAHRLEATRHWMEERLPLFLGPDFGPPALTSSDSSEALLPEGHGLRDCWRRTERLLRARRQKLLLAALKKSDAWQEVTAMKDKESGGFTWASHIIHQWTAARDPQPREHASGDTRS